MKILTILLFLLCTVAATAYWGRWLPCNYNDGRYYVHQSIENNIILGTEINDENYYYEYNEGYLGQFWGKNWKLLQIPRTYQPYLKYYFKLSASPTSNIKFYDRESQEELLDLEFVTLLSEDVEMTIFKKATEGMIFKGDGENKSYVVMVSSDLSRHFAFETPDEPFDLLECFFFSDKIILKTQSNEINYLFFDWDGKFLKQESEEELGLALYKVMPYEENYLIYNKKDDEYNVSEYNSELNEIKSIYTFEHSENVNRFVHHSGDYLFIMDMNYRVFTQKILSKNVTFNFTFDFMNYRYPVNTITEDSTTYMMFMDQHYGPEYNPKNFNEKMTDMLIYNPEKPTTYKKINQGLTGYNMQEFLMTGFYNSG